MHWYRSHLVYLCDGYLGAVFQDITAERMARQKLAETNAELERRVLERTDSLRRSQARLAAIFEHAADHVLEVQTDGKILYHNGRYHGTTESVYELCDPSSHPALEAALQRSAAGATEHVDIRATQGADTVELSLSISPIQNEAEPTKLVVIARDCTELRVLQRRVHLRERMATLGVLAAGVAHEVNSPLQHLMFALEQVRDLLPGDAVELRAKVTEQVDEALSSVRIIRRVVAQLRQFVQGRNQSTETVDRRVCAPRQRGQAGRSRAASQRAVRALVSRGPPTPGEPGGARAGVLEPDRQCSSCPAEGAAPSMDSYLDQDGSGAGGDRHRGQRPGHRRSGHSEDLRTILHHR
jgi:C4-dicarboxylate-specific signal transduction histidine kinase